VRDNTSDRLAAEDADVDIDTLDVTLRAGDMLGTLVAVCNIAVEDIVRLSLADEEGELETLTDTLAKAVSVDKKELTAVAEEVSDLRLVIESTLEADISDVTVALSESREEPVLRALSIDEADDVAVSDEITDVEGEPVSFAEVV
jgi:hypothetical protein